MVNSQSDPFTRAHDHAPSGQGNLAGGNSPVWHGASSDSAGYRNGAAQWGIRSKEFGGSGYSQLLFDDIDGQGRVLLPTYLRDVIGLGNEAVVVGSRDHAEIWTPADWDEYSRALDDPQALAEAFEGLGI